MINKIIAEYLRTNKRLVVPHFGAFIRKENSEAIVFVPFLKKDDGVLQQLLVSEYGMDSADAQAVIDEYIAEIKESIAARGAYVIEGVGRLMTDSNGICYLELGAAPAQAAAVRPVDTASPVGPASFPAPSAEPARHTKIQQQARPTEKTDKLGGQALLSDVMWFKKEMKAYHEWLERQVKKHPHVKILMETEATPELISEMDVDAAIIAVGAEQIVPPIPGVEKATMAFDVFGHEEELGKKVVIIGGGDIGCELSIHLSGLGHECSIVEMTHFVAGNTELTERMSILEWMEKENVTTYLDTQALEIGDGSVKIKNADGESYLEADSVIVSTGTRALSKLRDSFKDVAFDVINIGDCKKASNIQHAVESGFDAGYIL